MAHFEGALFMQDKKDNKQKEINFDDLVFIRLIDPIHIPKYLIEQIRNRSYKTDKFYDYQKVLCLSHGKNGPELNPSNFLYAIVNDKLKQVKGFLLGNSRLFNKLLDNK